MMYEQYRGIRLIWTGMLLVLIVGSMYSIYESASPGEAKILGFGGSNDLVCKRAEEGKSAKKGRILVGSKKWGGKMWIRCKVA